MADNKKEEKPELDQTGPMTPEHVDYPLNSRIGNTRYNKDDESKKIREEHKQWRE